MTPLEAEFVWSVVPLRIREDGVFRVAIEFSCPCMSAGHRDHMTTATEEFPFEEGAVARLTGGGFLPYQNPVRLFFVWPGHPDVMEMRRRLVHVTVDDIANSG